jgi:hypothetical protein
MIEQKLEGKPSPIPYNEKLGPSPMTKQSLPAPESTQALMSSANRAVDQLTAKPTSVRHQLGHGIPKGHPALEGMEE